MRDPRAGAVDDLAEPPGSGEQASWPAGRFTNPVRLAVVDSTNRYLRDAALAGAPEGVSVLADEQLAGRGRRGRSWVSPRGASVLVSVLFRPPAGATWVHLVPTAVALAARDAARDVAGVEVGLKWPNDLLVGDAKLGGVLAEVAGEPPAIVVGLGMNLAWPVGWPPAGELAALVEGATTLERAAGGRVERDRFEARLLERVGRRYDDLATGRGRRATLEGYRAACTTIGRDVRVVLGTCELEGRATGVADDGRLVVALAGGTTREFDAADVVHLRRARRPGCLETGD